MCMDRLFYVLPFAFDVCSMYRSFGTCCSFSPCSMKYHYVNRKLLVVEERHSPTVRRNSRGEF